MVIVSNFLIIVNKIAKEFAFLLYFCFGISLLAALMSQYGLFSIQNLNLKKLNQMYLRFVIQNQFKYL